MDEPRPPSVHHPAGETGTRPIPGAVFLGFVAGLVIVAVAATSAIWAAHC